MWRSVIALVVVGLEIIGAGCTHRVTTGQYTVASTKNTGSLFIKGEPVDGEDCFEVILIIPVRGSPYSSSAAVRFENLVKRLLEESKSDALVDVKLSHYVVPTFFWTKNCARIEGKSAKLKQGVKGPLLIPVCALLLIGATFAGCTYTVGEFSVLSTKPLILPLASEGTRQMGEDCMFIVPPFPLGTADYTTSMVKALEWDKADILVNVAFSERHTLFPFLHKSCFVVEGVGGHLRP